MKKLTLILGALSMVLLSSQSWSCATVAGVKICAKEKRIIAGNVSCKVYDDGGLICLEAMPSGY